MQKLIKIERMITILLLFTLVGIVFMEVVLRAFGSPTTWSVGIAQLLFIWLIFLGANQALRENAHIGVDVITNLLPQHVRKRIELVMFMLIIVFLGIVVVYGFLMVYHNTGRIISGTSIDYYFITLSIPVGAWLMLMTSVQITVQRLKELRGYGESASASSPMNRKGGGI